MNYAIILAGGIGSRFWPLSRADEPKQFLNVFSHRPMIEETVYRIKNLIKNKNIYVATNVAYRQKIRSYIKELNLRRENVFFEPQARNTFAPVGFLSWKIKRSDPKAVIAVLPCDHFIKYPKKFLNLLKKGMQIAQDGYIVTLGITPRRPETAYGYIKVKSPPQKLAGPPRVLAEKLRILKSKVYVVDRFIEKPSLTKAKKLIKDRRFYWNAGIFIFRADIMLQELKKFAPDDYEVINKIKDEKSFNRLWPQITSTSIDYAVMEKTNKMVLMPADFGWIDLGSWQAIEEFLKKDKQGNIIQGRHIDSESRNITVWAQERIVVTLGLNNLIIVDTKDALLVCAKSKTQEVKEIVKKLKKFR